MRIAVISDTHVPSRAAEIPSWVRDEVRAADHVVHAGDFDSREAYATVADLAPELTAVRGNMDPVMSDAELPEVASVELGGVRFVVTHGTGDLDTYRERVAGIVRGGADGDESDAPVVGVCGHTHRLMDEVVEGVRLLNPGSATGADPATHATMLVVRAKGGEYEVSVEEGP
ncbi:metallophosphoesterase family protein [Halomarina pelagica]|uniref:metallophosphoesterase family protein n=1 Tax=Halomarina pelagica TaxID=2961599 RepID=UPI0020C51BBC|nr:metallophosphoesterase family protein [Halomarina sp. BND7]